MNFKEIIKSIENRNFLPIYFLNGENTYFIDKILEKILDSVFEESEKDFNQTIFYGKDTSVDSILDALLKNGIPKKIHVVSVIGSQQGVDFISKNMPDNTTLWIGAIDTKMTSQSYIVPGLGDAGDLAFGIKQD